MKKSFILAAIAILVIGGILYFNRSEQTFRATPSAGPEIKVVSDVVGTRVGTTTTPVYYTGFGATTTKITKVSGLSEVIYTITAPVASTTAEGGGIVHFAITGSNDWDCATASTTGGLQNPILAKDIFWYDVGTSVSEYAGTLALGNGTTTFSTIMTPHLGKTITLKDINYECLKFEADATSTALFVQMRGN